MLPTSSSSSLSLSLSSSSSSSSIHSNSQQFIWKSDALVCKRLDLSVGTKRLIINSDVEISAGQRIALLGRNGCGKTTLFKWIGAAAAAAETPIPWTVYEVQQELAATEQSILSIVLAAHIERGKLWERRDALEALDDMTDEEAQEYNTLCDTLAAMNADADPPRASKILAGLGFKQSDMVRPVREFSGGWRARVALACGLFMEPDLLLLDEPTNHLDLEAVIWLGEFAATWKKTLVVITHNAAFAHKIANTVFHIDNQRLTIYKCSYNRYLKQREQTEVKAQKDWDDLQKTVTAMKSKGTPKDKKAAEAHLVKKMAEGIVRPQMAYKPRLLFPDRRTADRESSLLDITDATCGYVTPDGNKVILDDVSVALFPGDRVVVVGANGSGKTTLLRVLDGTLEPLTGAVHRVSGTRIRYFNQHFYHDLPESQTPIQYLLSKLSGLPSEEGRVRKLLGTSGLDGAAHTRPIGTLSGGQKARVYMVGLILEEPDILLLDEPTNHLDMETVEALQSALEGFPGALLLVSHDLDFLEALGNEVWMCRNGRVERHNGIEALDAYVRAVLDSID